MSACLSVCVFVCLCVRVSARSHISKITCPNFTKFCAHITCGRGLVLSWQHCMIYWCYILPILWTASCINMAIIGPVGQNKARCYYISSGFAGGGTMGRSCCLRLLDSLRNGRVIERKRKCQIMDGQLPSSPSQWPDAASTCCGRCV